MLTTSCLNVLTEIRTMYWNRIYQLNVNVVNNLRSQSHERTLINKTTELSERDYIVRVLYKYSY